MKPTALSLALVLLAGAARALAGTADIPIGYVPPAWVTASLRKTLSPQGRFVMLNGNGTVRVIDTEEKIAEVYRVLAGLQKAPALVSLNLGFVAFGKKTVERQVVTPTGGTDGFPFPRNFSAPKVIQSPNGAVTVVPSHPSNFQGRGTGGSATVTQTETTTEPTKQVIRRLTASSVPGKPAPVPVLAAAEDPAALRALALKLGAIKADEPAWTAAGTELLIRTEMVGDQLQVSVTPQVSLPGAAGKEARKVPLSACAAIIPITRAVPAPTGTLPRADAEFYRLFLGAAPAGPADVIALNLTGAVSYVGNPPP